MAEQKARRGPVFTSVDLAAIRQMEEVAPEAGRPGEQRVDVGRGAHGDDQRLLDVTHAIRDALEQLAALSDADRADRHAFEERLEAERREFEDRVTAKLDEVRHQLARPDDLERLQERVEKSLSAVIEAFAERSAREKELDQVLADGRSRLDGVTEQVASFAERLDEFGQRLTETTSAAADRLGEAVERMRLGTGDDQRARLDELDERLGSIADAVHADHVGLDARIEAHIEGLTTKVDGVLGTLKAEQAALSTALGAKIDEATAAVRGEQVRGAETVVERVEHAVTALDQVRRRDDEARADALGSRLDARIEARIEGLTTKVDEVVAALKADQAALSAALKADQVALSTTLAAKIDEATAALGNAESRLDAKAADERNQWRGELTALLDTFGHAFRLMSEDQAHQLQQGIETIRADLARGIRRPDRSPGKRA